MKIITLILLVTTLVTNTRAENVIRNSDTLSEAVVPPSGATHASEAPNMLPLSEGARKTFLLSMATTGLLRYVGEGLVPVPNHTGEAKLTLNNETSATPAALLAQLTSSRISVGIANPHRSVMAICELIDENGTVLLSGQAPAEVVPDPRVSGGYKIEQLEPIVLQCENRVPLLIENAETVDIVSRDTQGGISHSQTLYPNNTGAFDVWLNNYRFGELVVNFRDGTQAFYSFTTGERQQSIAEVSRIKANIPNYVEVSRTTTDNIVSMYAYYRNGEIPSPPTYRVEVLAPTALKIEVICRDENDNAVQPPTEWWYHRDGDVDEFMVPEFESYNQDSGTATFIIDTKPGVYWINAEGQEFRQHYWRWGGFKG